MANTLQGLITEATNITDESYDNATWVGWFNAALDDLASILYLDKKATITKNAGGTFTLPDDYIDVIRLDAAGSNLYYLQIEDDDNIGYKVVGGEVELQGIDAAAIILYYYYRPTYFSTAQVDTPTAVPAFACRALVFYAAAMAMMFEDEPDRFTAYNDAYANTKQDVQRMMAKKRPGRIGQMVVIR